MIMELVQEDINCLTKWAEGTDVAVDLGTYFGASAKAIAQKSRLVITIDVFEDFSLIENIGSRSHYKELYEKNSHSFCKVSNDLLDYKNILVRKERTFEVAKEFGNESINFIFIDADHSYKGVKKDFDAWFPKLTIGGVILFHDSTVDYWDVKNFLINEVDTREDLQKIDQAGSITVYRKGK